MLHVPRHPLKLARFGLFAGQPAALLARRWRSVEGRALFAGVAAHAFRPFGSPMSSAIGVTLGTAAHRYGWPVAEGGSQAIAKAMIAAARQRGAGFETGVEVKSLDELGAADVVMLDVAPAAAVRIIGERLPRRVARGLERFRHGPGAFKVDFAVEGGVPWQYEPAHSRWDRARRRDDRRDLRRRARGARRADAGAPVRPRLPAEPRRPRPGKRRRSTRSTPTPTSRPAGGATPPLRSRRRSSGSPPDFATASSPGTCARPRR